MIPCTICLQWLHVSTRGWQKPDAEDATPSMTQMKLAAHSLSCSSGVLWGLQPAVIQEEKWLQNLPLMRCTAACTAACTHTHSKSPAGFCKHASADSWRTKIHEEERNEAAFKARMVWGMVSSVHCQPFKQDNRNFLKKTCIHISEGHFL